MRGLIEAPAPQCMCGNCVEKGKCVNVFVDDSPSMEKEGNTLFCMLVL